MIAEFEKFHGVVVRDLVVCSGSLSLRAVDIQGRANVFKLDERIGLLIKHSTARLPPWQFTFDARQIDEIEETRRGCLDFWFACVCGDNGVMCISYDEFRVVNPDWASTTSFLRVDRRRNTRYRVFGTNGELPSKKSAGVAEIVKAIEAHRD